MNATFWSRRVLPFVFASGSAAAALVACTLTQSLDYLQKGDGGDAPIVVEAGPDSPVTMVPDSGREQVLVANQTKPGLLAQDDANLYWVAAGTVLSVPKSGGTPKMLGMAPVASSIAADQAPNGAVFLTVGNDIVRLPKDGSGGGIVFKAPAGSPLAAAVAADENALFLLQYDDVIPESFVLRMAKDGGAPESLSGDAGAPFSMVTDAKNVVWLDLQTEPPVFFDLSKTAPPSAAKKLPIALNDDLPFASVNLAADDSGLYWATQGANGMPAIVTRKRDVTASVIALYRGKTEDILGAIAVDATHIYAVEQNDNAIIRVPKSGGPAERLLTGLQVPVGLVVDATSFYVTVEATGSSGMILKAPK